MIRKPEPWERNSEDFTYIHSHQIPTTNVFFRLENTNVATIITEVAPQMVPSPTETFHLLEAGCSTGKETWSAAAGFTAYHRQFRIEAIDTNERLLASAAGPYPTTKEELGNALANWDMPERCLDYFEVVAAGVQPVAALRRAVTFRQQDIHSTDFGPRRFHAAVSNNVLGRHQVQEAYFERMVGNIAAGLLPHGVLAMNDVYRLSDRILKKHHLVPARELSDGRLSSSFHRYIPPEPRRFFFFPSRARQALPVQAKTNDTSTERSVTQLGTVIYAHMGSLPLASLGLTMNRHTTALAELPADTDRSDFARVRADLLAADKYLRQSVDLILKGQDRLGDYLNSIGWDGKEDATRAQP